MKQSVHCNFLLRSITGYFCFSPLNSFFARLCNIFRYGYCLKKYKTNNSSPLSTVICGVIDSATLQLSPVHEARGQFGVH